MQSKPLGKCVICSVEIPSKHVSDIVNIYLYLVDFIYIIDTLAW